MQESGKNKATGWIIGITILAALCAVVYFVGARSNAVDASHPYNGDMLGQMTDESYEDYQARAAKTLDNAPDEPTFGLISFTEALNPTQVAELTQPIGRVSAMLVGLSQPWPMPEPVAGSTRADVMENTFTDIERSLSGLVEHTIPHQLTAVVVWERPEVLKELRDDAHVATIEVLPPDSTWGVFGVQPVRVPGLNLE